MSDSDSDDREVPVALTTLLKAGQLAGIYVLSTLVEKEPCRTSSLSGEAWTQITLK